MNDKTKNNKVYDFFSNYIFQTSGIYFKPEDYYRLDARLKALCEHYGLETYEQLHQKFLTNIGAEMHSKLVDVATNNETYFFRDNKPFDAFSKSVVPELLKASPFSKVKIWSCGCSSGQEPYSMLISLIERSVDVSRVEITATDISNEILDKAKSGLYNSIEIQRGLPAPLLIKYFKKEGDLWKISDNLTSKVTFKKFNIIKDLYLSNSYDIVFCRNVVIYQNTENKRFALTSLFNSLKPDGYLFLGAGESLIGTKLPYENVSLNGANIYKKNTSTDSDKEKKTT
ncbi:MAG: CheR family methyltransferase [Bacteriovoracaceae bacterium]